MKKILLITNIPNAYRIPLFNELHDQLHAEGLEFVVVFAAEGYERRKSLISMSDCRFRYIILNSSPITPGADNEKTYFTYHGLNKVLKNENPYRIIVSGFSSATFKTWWYTRFNKAKYIIWSGSIKKAGRNDQLPRRIARKFLVKNASAFIAYGTLAKKQLVSLGALPGLISIGVNTVDTYFFSSATAAERQKLSDKTKYHLTYTGYLVPRKNVTALLDVAKSLSEMRTDFVLDIIGDGSDREKMELYSKQQKLTDFVKFHGFKQKNELPPLMAKSSIFLFQTGFDIWGLTLNEAMAAGLPCIASVNAGAVVDLIKQGENGFVADFNHVESVVRIINDLLDHPEKAEKMGKAAADYISQHATLAVSASGFVKAVKLSG
jgi:glycosyltransferase involved in cell wall biosynthesis